MDESNHSTSIADLDWAFLGEHKTQGIDIERVQSETESNHDVHRVSRSGADQFREHLYHLKQQRLFVYLTILAGVLIAINILQASIIHYVQSLVWIVVLPAIILIIALALITLNIMLSKSDVKSIWNNTDRAKKVAWIGIVASMFLPIIVCQFFYMPLIAVPKWKTIVWTSAMQSLSTLTYPAVAIIAYSGPGGASLDFTAAHCSGPDGPCNASHEEQTFLEVANATFTYLTFNQVGTVQPQAVAHMSGSAIRNTLDLDASFILTLPSPNPYVEVALYDPNIEFDLDDYIYRCGSPSIYTIIEVSLTPQSVELITISPTMFSGEATNSQSETWSAHCSPRISALRDYTYYDVQVTPFQGSAAGFSNKTCSNNNDHSCFIDLSIQMRSRFVSSLTSSPGLDPIDILLDEGAILGSILFFTWFLSIYV